jgi:hypothetical protein
MTESVSWKVYVDTRFEAADKAVNAALASAEKAVSAALAAAKEAVTKAETAANVRFKDGNHIKDAMLDAQKEFASKEKVEALADRLSRLENQLATNAGKSQGVGASFANINTVLLLGFGAIAVAFKLWGQG